MKHVRIQSEVTIQVTDGLSFVDLTKEDSDIANRLKVKPTWKRHIIKKGKGVYPAEIVEWTTVKNLEKDGVLTIGEFIDEDPEEVEQKPQPKRRKKAEGEVPVVQSLSLDELTEE